MSEITIVKKESAGFVASEKLWLTVDNKIVHDGDARAASLLVTKGGIIPEKLAKKLGLDKAIKIEPLENPKPVSTDDILARSTRPANPTQTR